MRYIRLVMICSLIIFCDRLILCGDVPRDETDKTGSVRLRVHVDEVKKRVSVSQVPILHCSSVTRTAFIDDPELEEAIIVQKVFQKGVGFVRACIQLCGYLSPVVGDAFGVLNSWPARKISQYLRSVSTIFTQLALWMRDRPTLPMLYSIPVVGLLTKRLQLTLEWVFLLSARVLGALSSVFSVTGESLQTMTSALGHAVSDSFFSLESVPSSVQAGVGFWLKDRMRSMGGGTGGGVPATNISTRLRPENAQNDPAGRLLRGNSSNRDNPLSDGHVLMCSHDVYNPSLLRARGQRGTLPALPLPDPLRHQLLTSTLSPRRVSMGAAAVSRLSHHHEISAHVSSLSPPPPPRDPSPPLVGKNAELYDESHSVDGREEESSILSPPSSNVPPHMQEAIHDNLNPNDLPSTAHLLQAMSHGLCAGLRRGRDVLVSLGLTEWDYPSSLDWCVASPSGMHTTSVCYVIYLSICVCVAMHLTFCLTDSNDGIIDMMRVHCNRALPLLARIDGPQSSADSPAKPHRALPAGATSCHCSCVCELVDMPLTYVNWPDMASTGCAVHTTRFSTVYHSHPLILPVKSTSPRRDNCS